MLDVVEFFSSEKSTVKCCPLTQRVGLHHSDHTSSSSITRWPAVINHQPHQNPTKRQTARANVMRTTGLLHALLLPASTSLPSPRAHELETSCEKCSYASRFADFGGCVATAVVVNRNCTKRPRCIRLGPRQTYPKMKMAPSINAGLCFLPSPSSQSQTHQNACRRLHHSHS